ncbi:uncharacterized protein LOC103017685 isoform X1 [Balaenoptera acutorostrata]|uniref:Uncharacterized protein LOC103017685 isoform X1 n=1 Tax=Balaenoptera acutorostrata TaxID=9767 RepID=A0ABM3SDS0_BALAC|nr:uncharacterized protein LOC103017685 isoform X1 [Balaenoptera acutorostrata]
MRDAPGSSPPSDGWAEVSEAFRAPVETCFSPALGSLHSWTSQGPEEKEESQPVLGAAWVKRGKLRRVNRRSGEGMLEIKDCRCCGVHLQPLVWIDHCGQGEGWKVYSRPACTGVTKTILSKMKNQDSSPVACDTASGRLPQHLKNFCVPFPSLGCLLTILPASGPVVSGMQAESKLHPPSCSGLLRNSKKFQVSCCLTGWNRVECTTADNNRRGPKPQRQAAPGTNPCSTASR